MKARKPEIHALNGALDKPPLVPAWLLKFGNRNGRASCPHWLRAAAKPATNHRSRSLAGSNLRTMGKRTRVRVIEATAVLSIGPQLGRCYHTPAKGYLSPCVLSAHCARLLVRLPIHRNEGARLTPRLLPDGRGILATFSVSKLRSPL